jgi:RNA polymerase subunit RPABC4/transcription elongation factor Spt4
LLVRKADMRQCAGCGLTTDSGDLTCPVCGRRLPLQLGVSQLTVRKIGLAILIPVLIWIVMTKLLA